MDDLPRKRYTPYVILFAGFLLVITCVYIAMQLNQRPQEVAGRAAPNEQTEQSKSSSAQNPRFSDEQRNAVPGLPKL